MGLINWEITHLDIANKLCFLLTSIAQIFRKWNDSELMVVYNCVCM